MNKLQDGIYILNNEQYQRLMSGDTNINFTSDTYVIPKKNHNQNSSQQQIQQEPIASNPIQQFRQSADQQNNQIIQAQVPNSLQPNMAAKGDQPNMIASGNPPGPNGAAGYPPMGAAGYPPMGAAGYPPMGAAGYPPMGAAGHPPMGAGGHPPIGAAGYPPIGAAGYPPMGAAGYPPMGAAGYPPMGAGYPPAPGNGGVGVYPPGPVVENRDLQAAVKQFSKCLPCLLVFYILLIIACIVVQYVLCGSIKAANLYISTSVFVVVSIIIIMIAIRDINSRINLVYATMFFTFLSFALGTTAFGLAVSHPPIFEITKSSSTKYNSSSYNYSDYYGDYYSNYYYGGYYSGYYSGYNYSSSSSKGYSQYALKQTPGQCVIYSDYVGLTNIIDDANSYREGYQYGILSLYCVAFLLTLIVFYNFFSKSWRCASIYRDNARNNFGGGNVAYVHPEQHPVMPYFPNY